jgi:transposase
MLSFVTEARSATGVWTAKLAARAHPNVAAVALANRQARIAWAVLARNRVYEAQPA